MTEPGRESPRTTDADAQRSAPESTGRADEVACDGGTEPSAVGRDFCSPTASAEGRTETVLHVDDDPGVGDLVTHFLQEAVAGVSVVTETDPSSALDRVARGDVDCVVTDLEMPGTDGLDLARTLDSAQSEVPVVLFTSHDWEAVAGDPGAEHVSTHVSKEGDHQQFETLARQVRALLD